MGRASRSGNLSRGQGPDVIGRDQMPLGRTSPAHDRQTDPRLSLPTDPITRPPRPRSLRHPAISGFRAMERVTRPSRPAASRPRELGTLLPFRPPPQTAPNAQQSHAGPKRKRSRSLDDGRHLNRSLSKSLSHQASDLDSTSALFPGHDSRCRKQQKLDSAASERDSTPPFLSYVDMYMELTYNPWASPRGKSEDDNEDRGHQDPSTTSSRRYSELDSKCTPKGPSIEGCRNQAYYVAELSLRFKKRDREFPTYFELKDEK